MVRSVSQRGFTLVEMMVASAVAGIAITAAFAFASVQVRSFAQRQDVAQLSSASRAVEDTIAEDIRNAGYATSFWAGTGHVTSFGSRAVVSAPAGPVPIPAGPLGVPAIQVVDNVGAPPEAQAGSDAITILRVEGNSTNLPSSGPGATGMDSTPGNVAYQVADLSALAPCGSGNGSRLVMISDLVRSPQPATMLQQIANIPVGTLPGPGAITFVAGTYGLDPNSAGSAGGVMPAPRQFGPGSLVTCVRLVTYWVDNLGRLRMFRSTPGNPAGAVAMTGAGGLATLPVDPANDMVVAEGVLDLQLALFMSGQSPVGPNDWILDANGPVLTNSRHLVEARSVRITATLSTPRADDRPSMPPPTTVENRTLNPAIFTGNFTYRTYTVVADLKNMRIFDLMSSNDLNWNQIRSFPQ